MSDARASLEDAVAYFLELRVRVRHSQEAREIVDRCLALIARASQATADEYVVLSKEVDELADELALRFGAPKTVALH